MKAVRTILIAIVLLIPTILAVWLYQDAQRSPVVARAVQRLELLDTMGETKEYVRENSKDADVISFLVDMNDQAEAVSVLPQDVAATDHFTATFFSYDKKTVYQYYISKNPEKGYIVDSDEKVFKVDSETSAKFACSEFAASLYVASQNPVLTLGGTTVVPSDYEWKYALANGEYRRVEEKTTKEALSYKISANLAMNFNVAPDIFNVRVMEGSEIIFEDTYANLVNLLLTESKTLTFHLEAKWYEQEGKEGQGYATYDFSATVNQPASFYLSKAGADALVPGDFVLLTAKDAVSAADISVTVTPDIGYTPKFVADGSYFRALVPIPYELSGGSYVLACTCDGVTQELTLEVENKNFRTQNYSISQDILTNTRTDTTLKSFDATMRPIATSLELDSGRMFTGQFGEGVPSTALLQTGIGVNRTINGGVVYRHQGVDYSLTAGDPITAVNAGKVIYVGETALSGTTIVIEHGFGLKSWYCHLSGTSVNVGDLVTGGGQIGTAGSTGFCSGAWAHIGLSVFDVPVSPYRLWESELEVPTP